MRATAFFVLVLVVTSLTPVSAQSIPHLQHEIQKLIASDAAAQDRFGAAVALQGETLVVGAPLDDDLGTDSGAVYVFTRSAGSWSQSAKLTAPDGASTDEFGMSVALDSGRILVGASRNDGPGGVSDFGAAYVFVESGASWSFEAKLVASDAAALDHLGSSVDLLGDRAIVGAPGDDDGGDRSGSAYVFVRSGGAWSQEQKLVAGDPHVADAFGSSVALDVSRALVGATAVQNGDLSAPGLAYVFLRVGSTWSQEQRLQSSYPELEGHFGQSVDIEGDTLVVGAPGEAERGFVHVFRRGSSGWSEEIYLSPLGSVQYRQFGWSVALEGDRIAIGTPNEDFPLLGGGVWIFKYVAGAWFKNTLLSASDLALDDQLGISVAMSGNDVVGGAWLDNHVGANAGSAYVFRTIPDGTFGTSFCFGDGSGTPCPCGNESAPGAGQGCRNTSGQGADLDAWGSTSAAEDDLRIGLSRMYTSDFGGSTPGVLAVGSNVVNGGLGAPFGAGLRCLAAPTQRLGTRFAAYPGTTVWGPGLKTLGLWSAGDTRRFQVWYRANPASAPCGAPFNLSSAIEITFTP